MGIIAVDCSCSSASTIIGIKSKTNSSLQICFTIVVQTKGNAYPALLSFIGILQIIISNPAILKEIVVIINGSLIYKQTRVYAYSLFLLFLWVIFAFSVMKDDLLAGSAEMTRDFGVPCQLRLANPLAVDFGDRVFSAKGKGCVDIVRAVDFLQLTPRCLYFRREPQDALLTTERTVSVRHLFAA